ncbi:MAG: hypothetical protein HYR49_10510 [Gammaproteobacteria bacterium]|nr:hypothetical protein [Gammaproteobacteria bacterium]
MTVGRLPDHPLTAARIAGALCFGFTLCAGAQGDFSAFEPYGDLRLRGDFVRDLPRPVDADFERGTARLRPGVRWLPHDAVEVSVAIKVNLSTDGNGRTRFNQDNEKADDVLLDEAFLLAHLGADTDLLAGQSALPLLLTPMIWDQDLRPQGVSVRHGIPTGVFSSLEFQGGLFLGNHLYGDESVIRAAQATLQLGEGMDTAWRFSLAWLDFSDLDELARKGLVRTNLPAADGTFANDFRLANAHAGVTLRQLGFPVRVRLDAVRNVSAGSDGFAGRGDLILGDSRQDNGIEFGFAAQRVQREALLAAFSDDDWWFRTRMRGWSLWAGYGITDSLRVRVSGFNERRDDAADHNWRALVDLQWSLD